MDTKRVIDNRTLVEEERLGFGHLYLVQHQTDSAEDMVESASVMHTSVVEVLS